MRTLMLSLCLALLALSGCLYGSGRANSTTTYTHDDGIHPVQRTSVSQRSSGRMIGASVPLMVNGYDSMYGMGYGGGNVVGYGGGSMFCVQYPDRCAAPMNVYVPQPTDIIVMNGGTRTKSNDEPLGPPIDISELQDRLHQLELQNAVLGPALADQIRIQCQMFLGQPELIKDVTKREKTVQSCTKRLEKK